MSSLGFQKSCRIINLLLPRNPLKRGEWKQLHFPPSSALSPGAARFQSNTVGFSLKPSGNLHEFDQRIQQKCGVFHARLCKNARDKKPLFFL
jgi:hypothetical protein